MYMISGWEQILTLLSECVTKIATHSSDVESINTSHSVEISVKEDISTLSLSINSLGVHQLVISESHF